MNVNIEFTSEEGSLNKVIGERKFKRSVQEADDGVVFMPNLMTENMMQNDLMAVSTPAKFREKRSKHSKKYPEKNSKRNQILKSPNTKDELMNILGAIREAKHHKLSRNDIRKLAKKAFARMKLKKANGEPSSKTDEKASKKSEIKPDQESNKKIKQKVSKSISSNKPKKTKEDVKVSKTAKEDEKAFSNIFEDSAKPKQSEFAEDISKLGDTAKFSEMLSDEDMTKKKSDFENNLEATMGKATASTKGSQNSKDVTPSLEQEVSKVVDEKKEKVLSLDQKKDENSKKSSIPDLGRDEKIKTLRSLLAKANKNKVPKKFLQEFPAGLRMIAWRELLEKKKKELGELEKLAPKDGLGKKSDKDDSEDHPVTVNIDIDPTADKTSEELKQAKDQTPNSHHIESHVKYLQKHLSSAQDLRKLISRALIGHCKATGKRILKAFVAMDKALARAQNIATVIGKKFKVDASKIETIVVNKEDEVVESFLRDIFSNFTPK